MLIMACFADTAAAAEKRYAAQYQNRFLSQ